MFAHNLNCDDEVTVLSSAEGPLVGTGKVSERGNCTYRVWLDGSRSALPGVISEFGRLGCLIEGYSERLVGVSCARGRVSVVENALRTAESDRRLIYESGRQ